MMFALNYSAYLSTHMHLTYVQFKTRTFFSITNTKETSPTTDLLTLHNFAQNFVEDSMWTQVYLWMWPTW